MQSRVFSKFNKRQERVNEQKNGVRFENYTEDNSVVFLKKIVKKQTNLSTMKCSHFTKTFPQLIFAANMKCPRKVVELKIKTTHKKLKHTIQQKW